MAGGTRTAVAAGTAGGSPAGLLWLAVAVLAALPLFGFGLAGLAAGLDPARVQPRAADPAAVASTCSCARSRRCRPDGRRAGRHPLAGGGGDRRWRSCSRSSATSCISTTSVFYALIVWVSGSCSSASGAAGLVLLAAGAAPRLHAAAAAVPLLEGLDRLQFVSSAVGVAFVRARGAGLPRGQHHRPRGLQAARRRGLLGAALPVPDHVLHLHLRGALPRAGVAQGGAARRRRCRSRC